MGTVTVNKVEDIVVGSSRLVRQSVVGVLCRVCAVCSIGEIHHALIS